MNPPRKAAASGAAGGIGEAVARRFRGAAAKTRIGVDYLPGADGVIRSRPIFDVTIEGGDSR